MTKSENENSAYEIEQCLVVAKENGLSYLKLADSYTRYMTTDEMNDNKNKYHKNGSINVYA